MKPPIITDDRTPEQREKFLFGVVCRDDAMSRWGKAKGGVARCGWACASYSDASKTFDWLKTRKEMKRIEIVTIKNYIPPRTDKVFHIYVVDQNHPALQEVEEYNP
jgi:hypothetical protein